jgi:hypothetical protein
MYIARQKRQENIAEYILYLWQLEDLFRALQFSPEAIYSQLVDKQQRPAEEKQAIFLWYMELIALMRSEGKEEHGHLSHTLHLIGELNDLHQTLLSVPAGERYRAVFQPLAPELERLRAKLEKPGISDVEFMMRSLYSAMLYRIKGDEAYRNYVEDVLTLISPVVAQLADAYRRVEAGEIDLSSEGSKAE